MLSRITLLALIILLMLSACDSSGSNSTPTQRGAVVPTRMATSTPSDTPTATDTLTPSHTPTATDTATPEHSPTPSLTPTPSVTPSPTPSPTPEAPRIAIGGEVRFSATNTISNAQPRVLYEFTADEGDVVSVQMNATTRFLDPFVAIDGSSGARLIENDDAETGGTINAAIRNFVIPASGAYAVVATRYREHAGPSAGDFELTYIRQSGSNFDPVSGIELLPLNLNENATGTISQEQAFVAYVFAGSAGDNLTIAAGRTSGDLDPYVLLIDRSSRAVLAENDDDPRGDTTNAYVENVTLPATGDYIVIVTRYQGAEGSTTGEYILNVSR